MSRLTARIEAATFALLLSASAALADEIPLKTATASTRKLTSQSQSSNAQLTVSSIQHEQDPKKSSNSAPLQARAEHSVRLSPVPDGMMQGGKFDEATIPKLSPKNNWVPIPKWLAGTWQFKSETVTHMNIINDKTRYPELPFVLRNEFQKTIGCQKDKTGQVWDYVKAPYSYTCKVDNDCIAYNRCETVSVVSDSKEEYIRKVSGADAIVEPESQVILKTLQKECISRYTPMDENAVRVDGSTKIFDTRGNAKLLKISNMLGTRAKPFEAVNEKDGEDLKKLFVEFLNTQGHPELIPD